MIVKLVYNSVGIRRGYLNTMTSCCDHINCHHYLSVNELCGDHSDHDGLVRVFSDDSASFKDSAIRNNVTSVQVCTKRYTTCQWDGICSLRFVRMINNDSVLVSDHLNEKFIIRSSSVV